MPENDDNLSCFDSFDAYYSSEAENGSTFISALKIGGVARFVQHAESLENLRNKYTFYSSFASSAEELENNLKTIATENVALRYLIMGEANSSVGFYEAMRDLEYGEQLLVNWRER